MHLTNDHPWQALHSRAVGRALVAFMFLGAAYNKCVNWEVTLRWTHDTMDGKGFALDRLFGVDDAGMVPILLALATAVEALGAACPYGIAARVSHCIQRYDCWLLTANPMSVVGGGALWGLRALYSVAASPAKSTSVRVVGSVRSHCCVSVCLCALCRGFAPVPGLGRPGVRYSHRVPCPRE